VVKERRVGGAVRANAGRRGGERSNDGEREAGEALHRGTVVENV